MVNVSSIATKWLLVFSHAHAKSMSLRLNDSIIPGLCKSLSVVP